MISLQKDWFDFLFLKTRWFSIDILTILDDPLYNYKFIVTEKICQKIATGTNTYAEQYLRNNELTTHSRCRKWVPTYIDIKIYTIFVFWYISRHFMKTSIVYTFYCSAECWSFMQYWRGNVLMQSWHKLCNVDVVKLNHFSGN